MDMNLLEALMTSILKNLASNSVSFYLFYHRWLVYFRI